MDGTKEKKKLAQFLIFVLLLCLKKCSSNSWSIEGSGDRQRHWQYLLSRVTARPPMCTFMRELKQEGPVAFYSDLTLLKPKTDALNGLAQ